MSIPIFMACNYLHKFNKNLFLKQKIGNTDCMTNALTAMPCLRKTSIVSDIIRQLQVKKTDLQNPLWKKQLLLTGLPAALPGQPKRKHVAFSAFDVQLIKGDEEMKIPQFTTRRLCILEKYTFRKTLYH